MAPIPLTLLTGFLGSGKTSLLSRALTDAALADAAVVINEFGEIALDHELLETSEETVVQISGGCLCCTIRDDLRSTLLDLARRHDEGAVTPFRRVVVESTGLADPAPVIHTLLTDSVLAGRFRLAGIVTTVDAVNAESTLDRFPEAVKQIAVADRIEITKTDLLKDPASLEDLRTLNGRLRDLNPFATLTRGCAAPADAAALLSADGSGIFRKTGMMQDWIDAPARETASVHDSHDHGHRHAHDVNRHGDAIRAHCAVYDAPIDAAAFRMGMELLMHCCGEDLLRVKAILNVRGQNDRPFVVQGAQHVLGAPVRLPAWPSSDRRTRVVMILRGLPAALAERVLTAFH